MSDNFDSRSEVDGLRRKLLLGAAAATTLGPWATSAHAAVEIEGVSVAETAMVGGKKLILNGASVRKRGYFKADVTALYLPAFKRLRSFFTLNICCFFTVGCHQMPAGSLLPSYAA